MPDVIDRRVLGAVEFLDATTHLPIRRPFYVRSDEARFLRNRSGRYVVADAKGLTHHTRAFTAPPPEPAPGSIPIDISVADPSGAYLPRIAHLPLPRNPDPANADHDDSLFRAAPVLMYRSILSRQNLNWSVIRVFVHLEDEQKTPVRGALGIVTRAVNGGGVLAKGISNLRGEMLIAVPGIPITQFAGDDEDDEDSEDFATGPVTVAETRVDLEIIVAPTLRWPVDPDVLEEHKNEWSRNHDNPKRLTLRTGMTVTTELPLEWENG